MPVTNQDEQPVTLFTRIFNDQYKKLDKGEIEAFPLPAGFLEVLNPANFQRIGAGVDASDVTFRIHLGHWFTDAADGTFEQDLPIFDLRDQLIALLSGYQPTACSVLMHIADHQNYQHTNVYVFEIDFICHFLDSTGSNYDPASTKYTVSGAPTPAVITPSVVEDIINVVPAPGKAVYRIPNNSKN